ncbi:hypothetical protein CO046_05115 [Candidatus Peregrinibacteria bacterium CG_4_9_14_0_2_um_filter_53_11]|nr:MAG: hypothetical protein CO046_05115 [Candidatus Peregrinibacteria bacterium CG_4_9_14_0_2_um_filter_53_11]
MYFAAALAGASLSGPRPAGAEKQTEAQEAGRECRINLPERNYAVGGERGRTTAQIQHSIADQLRFCLLFEAGEARQLSESVELDHPLSGFEIVGEGRYRYLLKGAAGVAEDQLIGEISTFVTDSATLKEEQLPATAKAGIRFEIPSTTLYTDRGDEPLKRLKQALQGKGPDGKKFADALGMPVELVAPESKDKRGKVAQLTPTSTHRQEQCGRIAGSTILYLPTEQPLSSDQLKQLTESLRAGLDGSGIRINVYLELTIDLNGQGVQPANPRRSVQELLTKMRGERQPKKLSINAHGLPREAERAQTPLPAHAIKEKNVNSEGERSLLDQLKDAQIAEYKKKPTLFGQVFEIDSTTTDQDGNLVISAHIRKKGYAGNGPLTGPKLKELFGEMLKKAEWNSKKNTITLVFEQ